MYKCVCWFCIYMFIHIVVHICILYSSGLWETVFWSLCLHTNWKIDNKVDFDLSFDFDTTFWFPSKVQKKILELHVYAQSLNMNYENLILKPKPAISIDWRNIEIMAQHCMVKAYRFFVVSGTVGNKIIITIHGICIALFLMLKDASHTIRTETRQKKIT